MLSDSAILDAIACGDLAFTDPETGEPLELGNRQLQPVSVDLTLGGVRDVLGRFSGDGPVRWTLWPGEFKLATTEEVVTLSDRLAATVEGKSTIARQGLQVHAAGLVDPGFSGQITLELVNFTNDPIVLTDGQLICQLVLHRVEGVVLRPYGAPGLSSHYQGQRGPTVARGLEDLCTPS